MFNAKLLRVCGVLTGTALLLQVVPGMLAWPFAFISFLSGLPIYVISRLNLRLGFGAYVTVGTAAAVFSMPEGILFLSVSGIAGLSLGLLSKIVESKTLISAFTAVLITMMLFLLNYGLGIHIFDYTILKSPALQAVSLVFFLFPCCFAYLNAAVHIHAILIE